jgi:hypothetical protein
MDTGEGLPKGQLLSHLDNAKEVTVKFIGRSMPKRRNSKRKKVNILER